MRTVLVTKTDNARFVEYLYMCFAWIRDVTPNVVAEWLIPLLRAREVPGLNLGPETGSPELSLSWFFSVPQMNAGIVP
jgi:hypothetical protein